MTVISEPRSLAIDAFNRRNWPVTLDAARQALQNGPHDAGMHYIAGVACMELQMLAHALQHLRQATRLDAKRAEFVVQLAKALSMARLQGEALIAADHAAGLAPTDPAALDTLGVVYTQSNAHRKAATMFRQAAALVPNRATFRFNLATALVAIGEMDEAGQQLEACLSLEPRFWKAHLTLAQLRRCTPSRNHVARLQGLLTECGDNHARMYLHLALAKELEDLDDYAGAFDHLCSGKQAGGAGRGYTIGRDEAIFDALRLAFPRPATVAPGDPGEEPIFVFGMPRSGTTLVERIISSHPDVHSAGELQNFGVVLKRLSGSATPLMLDPDTIDRASRVDPATLGRDYVASTRPATGHARRFVDKLPHNFLYAGFIAQALPNARLICLRRDPLDTCLGNFRQLFAQSSPYYDYSFDLLDTGRYYVLFDRLMAHWRQVFPGRILELDYEALVDSQEASSRKLLEFCGLPWDDACLRFHRNPQPVATASSAQVREPIHRGFIQRWRRYEAQLAPLRALLREAGIDPA
jgi:Tfp pilus assembly protein PilF